MQGKIPSARAGTEVYVGVDVCKAWLDVYLHPIDQSFRVANSKEGIAKLCAVLSDLAVSLVIVEATGKLHRLAHSLLSQAGYPLAVINPLRSRKFAEAVGQLAKTDRIDARLLALYGACLSPGATPVPAKMVAELQELVLARQAAKADETALKNRLAAAESKVLNALLKRQLEACARTIKALDAAIAALFGKEPGLMRRHGILASIKGIGPVVAATLAACLSELGLLPAPERSQAWPVSRPSTMTPETAAACAASKAAAPMSAKRFTWLPSPPPAAIPI
jgi:transposase